MPRIVTADEYVTLARPDIDWVIQRLIPRPGLILLVGPPKAGKSFLSLDIARRVAQGQPFLGQQVTPGPVLYLQFDTSEAVWRDRIDTLHDYGVDLSGPILFPHPEDLPLPLNILTPQGFHWMRQIIAEADPVLTIIDVLREIHTADENDSTEMKKVGDILTSLFSGRAVLINHHTKKIPDDVTDPDPVTYGRGTSYLTGKVDAFWLLHRGRLRITSRFDESTVYSAIQRDHGLFEFPEIELKHDRIRTLLALCQQYPDRSHSQLANLAHTELKISRPTYYRLMAGQECRHRRGV